MKKITLSLLAAFASCATSFSQVVLQQDFTSPFNVTANNWGMSNNSSALGSNPNWVQGVSSVFPAYNGAANDFFAANYNSVAGTGTISNWLFTPVVTIQDGAVLQFATRSAAPSTGIGPDRMQIRFSTAGTATNMAAPASNVGTYTNLMLDINPLYSLTSATAVTNGTMVNGYPGSWAVYTLVVTGVPTPMTGRFAFRYFVENGGPTGANSNYVGIDGVKYTLPCGASLTSYTTCANATTTLSAIGSPVTTYSWSNGSTGSSIIVNPSSTTVYTVYPIANGVPCGTQETVTITTAAQLGINVAATATQICLGDDVILSASSSANSYLWSTQQTSPVITVTPATAGQITYSVGGVNGACFGSANVVINVLPTPTIGVANTPSLGSCPGSSFTLAASGATLYNFIIGSNVYTTNPLVLSTQPTITPGTYTYVLLGQGSNGCVDGGVAAFTISPAPNLAIVPSSTVICVNKTLTLTASGAASYTWNGTSTLTANPYTVNTGASTGNKTYTVIGRSAEGCTATATRIVSVSACTGIENQFGDVLTVSAYPNPFSNEINVSGFSGRVEIFTALGQLVYSSVVKENEVINTSEFAKGVYMLKSYDAQGEEVKTFRLVKN